MTTEHWISSIFCDDIRHELSGKASAMGIFHGFIGLQTPSQTLPKLCILTFINLPQSAEPVDIEVRLLDHEADFMPPFTTRIPIGHGLPPQIKKGAPLTIPIEMHNCDLKDGMALSVQVKINGQALQGPTLSVFHTPQTVATAPTIG